MTQKEHMDWFVAKLEAIARVNAATARVAAIVESCKAANSERESQGYAQAYDEGAIYDTIKNEGIDAKSVDRILGLEDPQS